MAALRLSESKPFFHEPCIGAGERAKAVLYQNSSETAFFPEAQIFQELRMEYQVRVHKEKSIVIVLQGVTDNSVAVSGHAYQPGFISYICYLTRFGLPLLLRVKP